MFYTSYMHILGEKNLDNLEVMLWWRCTSTIAPHSNDLVLDAYQSYGLIVMFLCTSKFLTTNIVNHEKKQRTHLSMHSSWCLHNLSLSQYLHSLWRRNFDVFHSLYQRWWATWQFVVSKMNYGVGQTKFVI